MNCRHRALKISGTTIRNETKGSCRTGYSPKYCDPEWKPLIREMVGPSRRFSNSPHDVGWPLSHVSTVYNLKGWSAQGQQLPCGVTRAALLLVHAVPPIEL